MSKKRSSRLIIMLAALLLLIALVSLIWWLKPSAESPLATQSLVRADSKALPEATVDDESREMTQGELFSTGGAEFMTGLERLPHSLQGTDVDGEIIIDGNNQLVVTEGLRRLFDYFLSALGEEKEATIIARVEAYIRHHTPQPAASDAIEIFHQYMAYLKGLAKLQDSYGSLQMRATQAGELDLELVTQRRQEVRQLREQLFSRATIEAFFAEEDAYEDYSIAMIKIAKNDQLTKAQQQAAREDYIARLPDSQIKQNFQQQQNFGKLIERTEEMKAAGASAEALFAMRRELVGEAAALRLANLDAEEADFEARFNQYQAQKQRLLDKAGSTGALVQDQVAALERQYFDELERKRLSGYAQLKAAQESESVTD